MLVCVFILSNVTAGDRRRRFQVRTKHRGDKPGPNDARTTGERSEPGTAEKRLNDSQRGTQPNDGGNDIRSERFSGIFPDPVLAVEFSGCEGCSQQTPLPSVTTRGLSDYNSLFSSRSATRQKRDVFHCGCNRPGKRRLAVAGGNLCHG